MTDRKLIEKNRKRLLDEKKHLEGLLSRIAKKDPKKQDFQTKYPEFGNKEDENASEVETFAVNLAEEYDLEGKLHRVEAALERIEDGSYGVCLLGGEEMSKARLEAVPEAENCVRHAR